LLLGGVSLMQVRVAEEACRPGRREAGEEGLIPLDIGDEVVRAYQVEIEV
jgi:hypothetical protein